jgi:hypothetical protein
MADDRTLTRAAWRFAGLLAGALALGCGGQAGYAGLANAPNPNRPWTGDDMGRDAVANGTESCAPSGRPADDPLRNRVSPCPETPPKTEFKPRRARPAPAGASAVSAPAAPATTRLKGASVRSDRPQGVRRRAIQWPASPSVVTIQTSSAPAPKTRAVTPAAGVRASSMTAPLTGSPAGPAA